MYFFMLKQVKFIVGTSLTNLEDQVNNYLSDKDAESNITYDFSKCIAVVETMKASTTNLCCECRHWDDKGDHQALMGECPILLKRKRYNDKACGKYESGVTK